MAYTTINKSTDYFNTVLYTGTEPSNKAVTGVNFRPDLVWIKQRSGTEGHYLADVLRGSTKVLRSNETAVENDRGSNGIQSFDSDGFTAGGGDDINSNGGTFASWNWKANGTGSTNTDGSINSTVSVNTTSGFSIVKYTGTGAIATVGHGLGVTPKMIIAKGLGVVNNWIVYHSTLGSNKGLALQDSGVGFTGSHLWNDTNPTSSVFSLGAVGATNTSGQENIAYCFAEKTGYSKFGSYTGNGNADGSFIYCGFKPALILIKQTNATGSWYMWDNKRDTFNPYQRYISPNNANAEYTSSERWLDSLSNGFKWRNTETAMNGSGSSYIFMAFAEAPLVGSNNIPCTAR